MSATSDDWIDVTPAAPVRGPRIFGAAYHGKCNVCGFPFDEGDPIGYCEDEIACELCVYEQLGQSR